MRSWLLCDSSEQDIWLAMVSLEGRFPSHGLLEHPVIPLPGKAGHLPGQPSGDGQVGGQGYWGWQASDCNESREIHNPVCNGLDGDPLAPLFLGFLISGAVEGSLECLRQEVP